ncbi:MAG: hypothetical protein LBD12_06615, partial [Clostridiales Family XIII bacterium]|nr:hypothetical protein [Clostridiales Family XIII bacterium]
MKKLWTENKWVKRGCVVLPLLVLFALFCLWFFREQPILYGDKDSYYVSHIAQAEYFGKVKRPAADGGTIRKDMSAYADEIIAILADGRCRRVSFDPNARVSRWDRFDEEWTISTQYHEKGFILWLGGGTPACL